MPGENDAAGYERVACCDLLEEHKGSLERPLLGWSHLGLAADWPLVQIAGTVQGSGIAGTPFGARLRAEHDNSCLVLRLLPGRPSIQGWVLFSSTLLLTPPVFIFDIVSARW